MGVGMNGTAQRLPEMPVKPDIKPGELRGNHLSSTTCLTLVFFKSDE